MLEELEDTIALRGLKYGESFSKQSETAQNLKYVMEDSPNWEGLALTSDKREALQMIATKISRILHGDPDHHDSWHDIAGYAKLVADKLLTK